MRLAHDRFGSGNLACRYHSWVYDNTGSVLNSCTKMSLSKVQIFNESGLLSNKISESIGEALDFLGIESLGEQFHQAELVHDCNWKLIVENVLEGYHINSVHPQTFRKAGYVHAPFSRLKAGSDFSFSELPRTKNGRGFYRHAYLWPNLFLSNTSDFTIFMSCIFPVDENTTVKLWYLFDGPSMNGLPHDLKNSLRMEAINFASTALQEDKEIIEEQQKTITKLKHQTLSVEDEPRVAWFWDKYKGFQR